MALPAVKRVFEHEDMRVPRLRLVRGSRASAKRKARGAAASRSRASEVARCRRGFRVACVLLFMMGAIALARVELTVRATEASLTANALRADIESERVRGESLEARRMALATPSRIESIAESSMGMGSAESVAYIEMPESREAVGGFQSAAADSDMSVSSQRVAGILASIMRMTAGEAQVLLVGDAGLASSR